MTKPCNVRLHDTGVTHAKAWDMSRLTRCGIHYDHHRTLLFDETNDAIDCMSCLVKEPHTQWEWWLQSTSTNNRSAK